MDKSYMKEYLHGMPDNLGDARVGTINPAWWGRRQETDRHRGSE